MAGGRVGCACVRVVCVGVALVVLGSVCVPVRCTLGIFDFDLSFVYDSYPQPNEESDRPTLSIETMSTAAAALNAVLAAHSAFEVAGVGIGREGEGAAIELDTDASPIDGAKVLWDNNILGAPVYDKVKEEYVG